MLAPTVCFSVNVAINPSTDSLENENKLVQTVFGMSKNETGWELVKLHGNTYRLTYRSFEAMVVDGRDLITKFCLLC